MEKAVARPGETKNSAELHVPLLHDGGRKVLPRHWRHQVPKTQTKKEKRKKKKRKREEGGKEGKEGGKKEGRERKKGRKEEEDP
jgi:hypothetical protein